MLPGWEYPDPSGKDVTTASELDPEEDHYGHDRHPRP